MKNLILAILVLSCSSLVFGKGLEKSSYTESKDLKRFMQLVSSAREVKNTDETCTEVCKETCSKYSEEDPGHCVEVTTTCEKSCEPEETCITCYVPCEPTNCKPGPHGYPECSCTSSETFTVCSYYPPTCN